jgi:hypothetical protein
MNRTWDVPQIVSMRLPLSLGRDFTTYALVPTHRQLLLRSPMGDRWSDRIDLVFKGVLSLKVNLNISRLMVRKADPAQLSLIEEDSGLMLGGAADRNAYILSGDQFSGYVVAAAMFMAKDQLHATNPSPLLFDVEGTSVPEVIYKLE